MLKAHRLGVVVGRRWLIESITFGVAAGELVVVLGPNGAGKSTLMACLGGALRPSAGSVTVDGRGLVTLDAKDMARRRAVLGQSNVVAMPVHAEEIVALGRLPHSDGGAGTGAIVAAAMQTADADTFIGRSVPTLSGGEQQRVHLARALAQIWPDADARTRYLLLDEPTSSLDLAHQAQVMATARGLADAGYGVLAILHDLNLAAASADRIVVLDRGRIAAQGTPLEVLSAATIERVFGLTADVIARPDGRGPLVVPHALPPRAVLSQDLPARAPAPPAPATPAQGREALVETGLPA